MMTRLATWEDLLDRFARFKAMPCLGASGPLIRRPPAAQTLSVVQRQLAGWRPCLPETPGELLHTHVELALAKCRIPRRRAGRRPANPSLWNGLWRAIVHWRDDYKCYFCGRCADRDLVVVADQPLALRLQLDHVKPRTHRGEDYALDNVRSACRLCNAGRSRMDDEQFLAELKAVALSVVRKHRLTPD